MSSNDAFNDDSARERDERPFRGERREALSRSRFSKLNLQRGLGGLIALGVFGLIAITAVYQSFLIDVPTGKLAVLIRKTGKPITNLDEVAPTAEHQGIQKAILTESRYFKNPYHYTWEVFDQTVITEGKLGVKISLTGDDLPYGQYLATIGTDGQPTSKGIVPEVLRPGRYLLNPYLFKVEEHDPVMIQAGHRGVVTNLSGKMPKSRNQMISEKGERGVQPEMLEPGKYYLNPYVTRVNQVDCRSQRFNLDENGEMGFPSKDGFWVSLDGVIEFRIDPKRAAEVYVTYNQNDNGDNVDAEVVKTVILPNARSFCRLWGSNESGRQFISGDTRSEFQRQFEKSMKEACEPLGIEVIQALVTRIRPPDQIADPVRKREIAKQEEMQFQQQIKQQDSEQKLAFEKAMVLQKQALITAEQDVVKVTTVAEREQQVAVTKGNEQLAVAKLALEAAKDEGLAITARGKAAAEVIVFQNEAEAAGWNKAVEAFEGDGRKYAQYVLYQKLSTSYRRLMVNSADSPIMKIFEAFTEEVPNDSAAPAKNEQKEVVSEQKAN